MVGILFSSPAQAAPPKAEAPLDVKSELAYRAALGRGDDIALLLKKGADPNGTNKEGLPLLMVAAMREDAEGVNAVRALVEGGANVNIKDAARQTALYYAARAGKADVVDYLLKHKIDYYSLDKNGDIARTIAFRAGHTDIVDLMDNFVKSQTLQVQNSYQNAEKLLKEQQAKAAQEAAKQEEAEKKRLAAEAERERKEREAQLKKYQENLKKINPIVVDISYHACAFEYWSFCQSNRQTTPLSDEGVQEAIKNHKKIVSDKSLEVMKMFGAGQDYVNQIINPSQQMVFNQLNDMPSRTYRKENGVGTLEDLDQRCKKIAENWEVNKSKVPALAAPAAAPAADKKTGTPAIPGPSQLKKRGAAPAR